MADGEEKLRERLAAEQVKLRQQARKVQAIGSKLSVTARAKAERKKYLAGSWALDREQRDPAFAEMMRQGLDRIWLVRDDDRALWELPPLPEEEKQRRFASFEEARAVRNKRRRDAARDADRPEPQSGAKADHPHPEA
jgi:hypothetical protein